MLKLRRETVVTLRLEAAAESQGHDGDILACTYLPDSSGVLSAGWDGHLRLWDAGRGESVESCPVYDKPVSACTVSPDGQQWLVGTMDGLLAQWDARSRAQLSIFLAHTRPIATLVYSPDGQQLASASWDRNVSLWQIGSNSKLHGSSLGHHEDIVAGCRFTPDGKRLVSWSYDATAIVWDLAQRRQVQKLHAHEDRLTAGTISPDGKWFVAGARNGEVFLWDLAYGQKVNSLPLGAEIRGCYFLLDTETLVVVGAQGRLTLHQLPTLQICDEVETRLPVQAVDLSPSGAQLALGTTEGKVFFVSLDGFDSLPLAVTAVHTFKLESTLMQRLLGQKRAVPFYQCVCPACRAFIEVAEKQKTQPSACPRCRRAIRICAVTEAPQTVMA
jgi:WD40 repeat protein